MYRSEEAVGPSAKWKLTTLPTRNLANGDRDRCLKIEIWKAGLNGYHTSRGCFYTTVNKMLELHGKQPVGLTKANGTVILNTAFYTFCILS